jgi:hypothetical protein
MVVLVLWSFGGERSWSRVSDRMVGSATIGEKTWRCRGFSLVDEGKVVNKGLEARGITPRWSVGGRRRFLGLQSMAESTHSWTSCIFATTGGLDVDVWRSAYTVLLEDLGRPR